jgi:hypothetical protein
VTFRTLEDRNAHARECEGALASARITESHRLSSEILAQWQDAPSDIAPERHNFLAPTVLKDFEHFIQWVQSPAGYGSLGTGRAVNSKRTIQIISEDIKFLLSHMPVPTLEGFCNQQTVATMIAKVVSISRSASRMYNLMTACEKVRVMICGMSRYSVIHA